ncbi:hypothetical protein JTE90_020536 [Oedothorax gibbosus]|uniref:Uncharacterized protein n=1 Tax=Oedothorax gibbosus TaxID=931172 RepID=A0AAV6VYT2_9ARAC|nr:hypothetical protein JTE90_020536 [Oedothorax gibbosus]
MITGIDPEHHPPQASFIFDPPSKSRRKCGVVSKRPGTIDENYEEFSQIHPAGAESSWLTAVARICRIPLMVNR